VASRGAGSPPGDSVRVADAVPDHRAAPGIHDPQPDGHASRGSHHLMDIVTELAIVVLAGFVGFLVISKVPNTLHTPLMSGTNAIHGIVLLGGLVLIGEATGFLNDLLLVIAIAFGTINVVGGFLVTDRMLEMFKGKKREEVQKGD
jgi:NAD(P) transhydrogenase subunit alpha